MERRYPYRSRRCSAAAAAERSSTSRARSAVRSVFDEVTLDQLVSGDFPAAIRRLYDSDDAWTPRTGPQVPTIPRGNDPEWRI